MYQKEREKHHPACMFLVATTYIEVVSGNSTPWIASNKHSLHIEFFTSSYGFTLEDLPVTIRDGTSQDLCMLLTYIVLNID